MHEIPEEKTEKIAEFHVGDKSFHGERIELWVPTTYGTEVACGANDKITIRDSNGVSETDQAKLRSYCELSLGIENVKLFQSGLEASLNTSITWSASTEATINVPLIAPKCGRALYTVYCRKFIYQLKTYKTRFLRKPVLIELPKFTEHTKTYIARIHQQFDDPNCPCDEHTTPKGMPVRTKLNFNDRLTAFVDGFIDRARKLKFMLGDSEYSIDIESTTGGEQRIAISNVPDFFLLLSGLEKAFQTEMILSAHIDTDANGLVDNWLLESELQFPEADVRIEIEDEDEAKHQPLNSSE